MDKTVKVNARKQKKQTDSQLKHSFSLLLFAYLFVPAFTPNFSTLDSNGPKFVVIGILNLVSLIVLYNDRDFRNRPEIQSGFFRNLIGLAYTIFLLFSLLSFIQAGNISESIINFAKIFSVFASIYAIYVIFRSNSGYVIPAVTALVIVLLFDCATVFYHISQYIGKNVTSIYDIKSVYSHKNILSASLFIKIPAAVWLILFTTGSRKKMGGIALFLGILALLFLSSRAFYLGLAAQAVALALYFTVRHFVIRKKLPFRNSMLFAGIVVFALILFTIIQRNLYPVNQDTSQKFNTGLIERLSTIRQDESSTNARLNCWKRSWLLIKEHPFMGVGSGNWKVEVLKYEAPESDNFIISYKNHNDFIEVTAETGILGGIAYLGIFVLIIVSFIRITLKRDSNPETIKFLFLAGFGILAYGVDAFFNFPNDRPEIQSLFAIYAGLAIAVSGDEFSFLNKPTQTNPLLKKLSVKFTPFVAVSIIALLLIMGEVLLIMNVQSLYFQRIINDDQKSNKYSYNSSYFINGFPAIPNLTSDGAPISTYIARYLMHENHSDEAVKLMLADNPSPYDGRREYYLSMAYDYLGDSVNELNWGRKANKLKPRLGDMALILSSKLFHSGEQKEAVHQLKRYLKLVKTNPDAWLQAARQFEQMGKPKRAIHILDSAILYLPKNEIIRSRRTELRDYEYYKPYKGLYDQAMEAMVSKKYHEAIILLNDFIVKKPKYSEAFKSRAVCYYYLREYTKSIQDVNKAIKSRPAERGFLINLRGINLAGLKKWDAACKNFKLAMEKGSPEGLTNYENYCGKNIPVGKTDQNSPQFILK